MTTVYDDRRFINVLKSLVGIFSDLRQVTLLFGITDISHNVGVVVVVDCDIAVSSHIAFEKIFTENFSFLSS